MTPDVLKQRVVEEFNSIGLLKSLDVETSAFRELPRLFEVSHLSMRLVLDDVGAVTAASSIAAEIKRELERQGVELEYEIRAQWKVVRILSDALDHCGLPGSMPSEEFKVEVASGSARRYVTVYVSAGARTCILQYLSNVAAAHWQRAMYELLESCINQKLSSREDQYWDPILYPSRNIEGEDVARTIESRTAGSAERELVAGL